MEREKSVNNWLPVTASRKGNWWYSAFHNVNAIVGTGVLGLPFAMSELGWVPGIVVLIIAWVLTLFTMWQLVEMHETVPRKRFNRYHELGQHAFGKKLGLWIILPQQLLQLINTNIVYMVIGGKSLQKFHDIVSPASSSKISTPLFILIFASSQFVVSQLPSLSSISFISLVAAIMSISYSTVAWGASLSLGRQEDAEYGYIAESAAGTVFRFFNALGTVAFAYAGHGVVLEIQATIPSTPEKPSKGAMLKGIIAAYVVITLCYFPVAIVGYWVFGNGVTEVILDCLKPRWMVAMANMMVAVHIIGGYQINAMPVFDITEAFLITKIGLSPGYLLRLVSRSIYVAFTTFAAISFPFFSSLLGFIGGFAVAPVSYFMPCIMWLAIYKPRRYSLSWLTNWICIILGVLLMLISAIGVLRKIIVGNA